MFTKGGNLVEFARVEVMVTNYTCCLNKICIWNTIVFGNFTCFRHWYFEAQPHIWDFNPLDPPSGFGKFGPGLWYTEGMTNGQSLSGRRGNSVQMLWKIFAMLLESFSMFPPNSLSLSLNTRLGSIAPCTRLCFPVSQSPWSRWLKCLQNSFM